MEQDVQMELTTLRVAFEYLVAPLIAAHPEREGLLRHLQEYRRQVVASRDPWHQSMSELLNRVDRSVRLLPEGFPNEPALPPE